MDREPEGTKLDLVLAAGEIFAQHGFEGTSTRAIAEKAGANIASICYHFGSKQRLYTATLLYAIHNDPVASIADALGEPARFHTPQEMAGALNWLLHQVFGETLSAREPRWRTRLFLRCLLDDTPSMKPAVDAALRPDLDALKAFAQHARPELSDQGATLWALGLLGQIGFYMLAQPAILAYLGQDGYTQEFLDAAAANLSRWAGTTLGLPPPEREAAATIAGAIER